MPRPAKGPRLYKHKHRAQFYIADTGIRSFSTGCTSRADAEAALSVYIATKGRSGTTNEPENVTIAEVLTIYATEHAPTVAAPERIGYAIDAMLPFWASLKVSHIRGETCRRYAKVRDKSPGTIRRELGTLQAAINHAHREGYITSAPVVTLPQAPEPKERWLTRAEAAKLLHAAYRGPQPHLAHFILIALYTGTRKDAILRMGMEPNTVGGWFDLENEIMFRRGAEERQTKKRRKPAPIPRQLAGHLKRWKSKGARWAVEKKGARCGSIEYGFRTTADALGMRDVTPHTLKHTAITWALQNGATIWDVAGFFSTSPATIERVYGHHSDEFMASALRAVEGR
jgi:integrase